MLGSLTPDDLLVARVSYTKGVEAANTSRAGVRGGTLLVKRGFAHMQKHGVIMDVTHVKQAQVAEEAGVVAVIVLDKLFYDVRKAGGVARTASLKVIAEILDHVTIPVMAKCRIGHTYEARVLEEVGVDMIDESGAQKMVDESKSMLGLDIKNLELRVQKRGTA